MSFELIKLPGNSLGPNQYFKDGDTFISTEILDIVDSLLLSYEIDEVLRCIQLGLLCFARRFCRSANYICPKLFSC